MLLGATVVAAAAAAVVLGLGDGAGAGNPTAPLSENDVRDVAQDFAQAYDDEDGAALRRTLTPGVERVLPSGVARGRKSVVNEYERQFRSQDTSGYELDDLEVSGGRAGRASGSYRVERKGRDAIEGRIVFGVVRDHGQPRIGADRRDAGRLSAQQARATTTRTVLPRRTWLPAEGSCSHTPRPLGTSESRKPPPRWVSSVRPRRSVMRSASSTPAPTRSGTATRCSRVTRKAVSAAERLAAVAATSITFGPGSSGTSELKRPPLTCARRPWTCTRAVLGLTLPLTRTVLPSTSAVSWGSRPELHRRLRLLRRRVLAAAPGEGDDENRDDKGSEPKHDPARLPAPADRLRATVAQRRAVLGQPGGLAGRRTASAGRTSRAAGR